jgi:integrase
VKLTDKTTAALKLDGKTDAIHFDTTMPGFGYRLRRGSGGKLLRSWIAQYRHGGQTRRLLLGSAEVVGAEQARTMAKKALGRVANGEDPQAERSDRRGRDKVTMRAVVAEFLAAREAELAARTFVEIRRYLTDPRYFGPLHGLPIDAIARRDIAARVVAITRESGAPTAARARDALCALFTWSMRMGFTESNPIIGVIKPATKPRERVLTDKELAAIWRACGDDEYDRIIRLLILTGCRRAEIGDMTWSEIAPNGTSWTLPASRSKNGRPHTLPIMPMMREIIATVPHMATRDALFGQRSHGFTNWTLPKPALDERSGVTDWTVHDIRRTVATRMNDIGIAPHIVEAVLNHQSGTKRGIAGVYNRSSYEREVRAALALWHDHVRTLVAGGERKVVQFMSPLAS